MYAPGLLAVLDMLAIAPWLVLRTAIRQWSVSYGQGFGQMSFEACRLVRARKYDLRSESTLALVVLEELF